MLEGEKVRLLAVDRENLPKFLGWVNDPEVTQYLMVDPPLGMEQEEAWFEGLRDREAMVFTIETKEGEVIGNCGLEKISWKDRKATLGIMIGSKMHWDKGYGTDAVRTLLMFAFDDLNLMRLCLICDQGNVRAQHAYEKCGFRREGVMRAYRFKNGAYVDEVLMSIIRPEWLKLQKRV
jgi:RimJ/RimL family protein N-acetyltransferase